jgi:hypothetical protein
MNADQYYQYLGTQLGVDGSDYFIPQPYYPMIADYEKWFSITATPYGTGNIIGFTNDGSEDQLLYYNAGWNYNPSASNKAKIAGLYLTIIREGQEKQRFLIDNLNEAPGSGESSIYSPYSNAEGKVPLLDVSGNNVFVIENADLAFTSNSVTYNYKESAKHNQNAFFGKGIISRKVTTASLGKGQFAITTNNQELINALIVGDYVVAQYEYEGLLNEVESGIGFHKVMRDNNVDKPMTGDYNIKSYPRAMFGRKSDGTIALVTVDMNKTKNMSGVNMEEANAILKHYGIVEGYQVDGGGSVTMVVKDGDGFRTVNSPSEGNDRNVLSALLFVVKDIGVKTSIDIELDKVVFNVHIIDESLEKVSIKMNNETKEVINGKVEFTNLTPSTQYKYQYLSVKGGVLSTSVVSGYVSTLKRRPVLSGLLISKNDEDIIVTINIDDPDKTIVRKSIEINGVSQSIIGREVVYAKITDFDLENIKIKISYDLYDGIGRQDLQTGDIEIRCDMIIFIGYIKNKLEEKVGGIYE